MMRLLKFLLGWPLSIIALIFIGKIIFSSKSSILHNLNKINGFFLVLGIICFVMYYFFRSLLWQNLLKNKGYSISLKETIYLWIISEIKRFIPGNIWSFLGRTDAFSKKGLSKKHVAQLMIFEGEFLILGSVGFSLLGLPFIFHQLFPGFAYKEFATYCVVFTILGLTFAFLLLSSRPSHAKRGEWRDLFTPKIAKISKYEMFSKSGAKGFLHSPWSVGMTKEKFFKCLFPPFSYVQNLSLYFISLLYFFFFGIGTFFTVISVHFINQQNILTLAGFFVFSFFVGYISLITPMGLGVREAVMTAGLVKFMPVAVAGFAAIFARIVLIVSELIFLGLSIVWYNLFPSPLRRGARSPSLKLRRTKGELRLKPHLSTEALAKVDPNLLLKGEGKLYNLVKFIKTNPHEIILGIFILAYIIYFTTASFYRYTNFYTGRFDLGNMDQTIWNTIHGHIFQLTNPDGTNIISRLSFHADFLLILLAPFYMLWQDPRMILLIQTIMLALGAIFVYLIAKNVLKNKNLALLFGIMYLFNPGVQYSNLYDFHASTLATAFLLGAFFYLLGKKYILYLIFLLLAALTKEQVWIVTAMFGIYTALKGIGGRGKREGKNRFLNFTLYSLPFTLGLSIFLISIIAFYYIFFRAIPAAHGGGHFALAYYSDFGTTPRSIMKKLVLSPQKTFGTLYTPDRIEYVKELFLPLGYLPLAAPLFLIFALPDLLINLLSNNPAFHQIYYQYTAVITPFLFIAAIYGVRNLGKFPILNAFPFIGNWKLEIRNLKFLYLAAITIFSVYLYSPLPGTKSPNLDMFIRPQPYRDIIENFLTDIPQKYSIASTNNLGSHLSHRQKIFTIPVGIDEADIILFLLNDTFAAPSLSAQREMSEKMKRDKNYIEIFRTGDFIVFEKRNLYTQQEPDTDKIKLFPLSIPTLESRDFVGGKVHVERKLREQKQFSSYLVAYPSDGLKLFALMNIPKVAFNPTKGEKPINGFPVIIVNHGLVNPPSYDTEKSYSLIADYFASKGFLVLKPDYRGNGNSEKDINMANSNILSYPIDVLNLLNSLSAIPQVNPKQVFLWGHSTGAAVALTVLEANNQNSNFVYKIKGTALWSPVIDPYRAYQQFSYLFPKSRIPYQRSVNLLGSIQKNPILWQSVSPLSYIDDITSPIQIMHGTNDNVIPYQWSIELYDDVQSLGKQAYLQIYPNDDHVLSQNQKQALEKNVKFFRGVIQE